jgi:transposase-like protein
MKKLCEKCGKEFTPFLYDTMCYSCKKKKHQEDIADEIKNGETDETDCEDEIYCPYCGELYEPDCEYELYEEGEHDLTCGECDKEFIVTVNISYSYDTKRKKKEAE